jgi:murein L,D-transpeptidase YcbB/YkuD
MSFFQTIGRGIKKTSGFLYDTLTPGGHAHRRDKQMWREMNQYNHPAQQMERLREAGLNPNLMYGQGQQTSSGIARQMPQYQAESAQMLGTMPQIIKSIGELVDASKSRAQTRREDVITEFLEASFSHRLGQEMYATQEAQSRIKKQLSEMLLNYQKFNTEKYRTIHEAARAQWQRSENKFRAQYGMNSSDAPQLKVALMFMNTLGIPTEKLFKADSTFGIEKALDYLSNPTEQNTTDFMEYIKENVPGYGGHRNSSKWYKKRKKRQNRNYNDYFETKFE